MKKKMVKNIHQKKTVEEINQRIIEGSANVVTADEMPSIVEELGVKQAAHKVDVVTTGTFGAMCSSGVWLNFGHADPPIKIMKLCLNDVPAYTSVAAVDAYLGAGQPSISEGIDYGGAHVIEDLIRRKEIYLEGTSTGTDCYPRRSIKTSFTVDDLNQAVMSNPRNAYERYNAAVNSSNKTIYTYLGKLLPNYGNGSFSGAGELSPLINDPTFQTIGIGSRIFLGGAQGYVTGNGTQHDPSNGFSNLMVQGNLKKMDPKFVRGGTMKNYGCTLFLGIGIPIPILNEDLVKTTAIRDKDITTSIIDYSVPNLHRPTIKTVNYEQLKSGRIEIDNKEVNVSSISSTYLAKEVASQLRNQIKNGQFLLTSPVKTLTKNGSNKPMSLRKFSNHNSIRNKTTTTEKPSEQFVRIDDERCVHCGICVSHCPFDVFVRTSTGKIKVDVKNCQECLQCKDICPHQAIFLNTSGDDEK
jgi:uncharacterized protein (DUF39 family)/ferredoxin